MRRLLVLVVLALVGLVAGCSDGDDNDDGASSSSSSSSSSTSSSTTEAPATTVFEGATTPTSLPLPAGTTVTALLADVRAAAQPGFDRVVFEFRDGGLPAIEVGYIDPPVLQDGSGEPIEVAGEAFLQIRMEPASSFDFATESPSYDGPTRVTGDTATVTEVVRTGDFEANLTWVIGVRSRVAYRVVVLDGPPRLVIELAA